MDRQLWEASVQPRSGRKSITFPSPPTGQKIRLRGGKSPYSGYLEIFYNDQWGFVCDAGSWTLEEANLVCQELGFKRGVRSTTQGFVHGPVDEDRKMTENVDCKGHEKGLSKCRIRYKDPNRGNQRLTE